jgi:hypothetical protein
VRRILGSTEVREKNKDERWEKREPRTKRQEPREKNQELRSESQKEPRLRNIKGTFSSGFESKKIGENEKTASPYQGLPCL